MGATSNGHFSPGLIFGVSQCQDHTKQRVWSLKHLKLCLPHLPRYGVTQSPQDYHNERTYPGRPQLCPRHTHCCCGWYRMSVGDGKWAEEVQGVLRTPVPFSTPVPCKQGCGGQGFPFRIPPASPKPQDAKGANLVFNKRKM